MLSISPAPSAVIGAGAVRKNVYNAKKKKKVFQTDAISIVLLFQPLIKTLALQTNTVSLTILYNIIVSYFPVKNMPNKV